MKQALIVGAGGFVGCIARYLVGVLVTRLLNAPVFPYATLLVNIVGCLLIGVLGGLAQSTRVLSPELQLLLITGLLGGFTTYSTFGYQAVTLLRDGHLITAILFVATHLALGLWAVWFGLFLVRAR
jgi:CrcB protein